MSNINKENELQLLSFEEKSVCSRLSKLHSGSRSSRCLSTLEKSIEGLRLFTEHKLWSEGDIFSIYEQEVDEVAYSGLTSCSVREHLWSNL